MNQADDAPLDPGVANRHSFEAIKEINCLDGWNTYELRSEQNASAPDLTIFTLKKDAMIIYSDSHPTKLLPSGQNVKVYVSSPSYESAKYFHVQNFFMVALAGTDICDDTTFCPPDAVCSADDFSCTCHEGTENEGYCKGFYR